MKRSGIESVTTQRGAALVVVMILLVVMTLLVLFSLRGTLLQERMSANLYDRSLAFQAAETALREGEAIAAARPNLTGACSAGLCGKPVNGAAPVWQSQANWNNAPEVSATELGDMVDSPRYMVELLADDVPARNDCTTSGDISETTCVGIERRYRITSRSQAEGRAEVILQSIYSVP